MVYVSGGNELLDPVELLTRLGVKQGSSLADLGCGGAGHFVIPAAQMAGKNAPIYAVDILKSALQAVSSKALAEGIKNIKTVWSNIEIVGATRIKSASLDFVLIINNLFQSEKCENVFAEAFRLLKSGGRLLVVDWGESMTAFGPALKERVSQTEAEALGQKAKFKEIESFQAGAYHYGIVFEKP